MYVSFSCILCPALSDQSMYVLDKTSWDVTRFADRVKNTRPRADGAADQLDLLLAKFFHNPEFCLLPPLPAIVTDMHGQIMVWYLPGILSALRVVSPAQPC